MAREGTVTTKDLPAKKLPPVRAIDFGVAGRKGGAKRVGGLTIFGEAPSGVVTKEVREAAAKLVQEKAEASKLRAEQIRTLRTNTTRKVVGLQRDFQNRVRKREFTNRNQIIAAQQKLRQDIQNLNVSLKDTTLKLKEAEIGKLRSEELIAKKVSPKVAPSPFISEVQPFETFGERLKREIRKKTPNIKFLGENKFSDFVEKALGIATGTVSFTKGQLAQELTDVRDAQGNRIFQPKQAERIVDLAVETGVGFGTGLGVGKAFTFAKGGILSLIPKTIKGSAKVSKLTKILGFGTAAGLGTLELKRIVNTFQKEGTNPAIVELISVASFARGFVKTGFKPSAKAEADFKKFANALKKPKAKKGQVALLRKKKKKDPFARIEGLEEIEAGLELEAAIKRELINAKNPKAQFDILTRIKEGVKTPEQKAGFKTFVEKLIEEKIVKVPKVEIKGKQIVVTGFGVPKPVVAKAPKVLKVTEKIKPSFKQTPGLLSVTVSAIGEEVRVQAAQVKNQERITQAQKPLGQKYAEAQKTKQKEVQKTIQLLGMKQKQETLTRTRTASAQKLVQLLTPALDTATKQKLVQKQVARTTPKLRRMFRRPVRPVGVFGIPLPLRFLGKKVRRKVSPGLREVFKPGYNTFVKQKGKFIKSNVKPLVKKEAQSLGAFVVDKSLSATFKVKKTSKGAKKSVLQFPKRHFQSNLGKFRRGKRNKNLIIERRRHRLDSLNEVRKIQAARVISDLKRKRIIPLKLKSTSLIKIKRRKK